MLNDVQLQASIHGMSELLKCFGMDLENPSVEDTPLRFIKYLEEFYQPFNIKELLGDGFRHDEFGGIVAQTNIPFRMICEHHLLPAWGTASIGYIPNKKVVGLSKLTRLVQAVGTEKPSLQEDICKRIANHLKDHLEPLGVIVVIKAEHGCMACRGVNSPGVVTITSSIKGIFLNNPEAKKEFFSLTNL